MHLYIDLSTQPVKSVKAADLLKFMPIDHVSHFILAATKQEKRIIEVMKECTARCHADVLKLSRTDIKEGALHIDQNKAGKKLRTAMEGKLADVIHRMMDKKAMSLLLINTR